jgi:hypothetical protein
MAFITGKASMCATVDWKIHIMLGTTEGCPSSVARVTRLFAIGVAAHPTVQRICEFLAMLMTIYTGKLRKTRIGAMTIIAFRLFVDTAEYWKKCIVTYTINRLPLDVKIGFETTWR